MEKNIQTKEEKWLTSTDKEKLDIIELGEEVLDDVRAMRSEVSAMANQIENKGDMNGAID